MDNAQLNRNAGRVAGIFNTLSMVIVVLGVIAAISGFFGAIASETGILVGVLGGIIVVLFIGLYVALAWAGVQMAALVAGYIHVRTSDM